MAENHFRAGRRQAFRGRFPDKLDGLVVLDFSLLVIWAAANLYETASRGGSSLPILLGLVLLLALLWELAFSGTMLNPGEPTSPMPHRARVVAYVGFLMLTATAVLQLTTLHSVYTGGPTETFESETAAAAGIVEFGVPFAITFFLVRWFSATASLSIVVPSRSADQAPDRQLPAWAVDRLRSTRNGLLSQDCAEQDSGS